MTRICVGYLTIIGSDNGLSPGRRQAITWIVNWTPRNKLQWNVNRNSYIFIQGNPFENVVWKMAAILSRPQCVNVQHSILFILPLLWKPQVADVHYGTRHLVWQVRGSQYRRCRLRMGSIVIQCLPWLNSPISNRSPRGLVYRKLHRGTYGGLSEWYRVYFCNLLNLIKCVDTTTNMTWCATPLI